MATLVREEDREETEAKVRIRMRMRMHTTWLLAGATGPEPLGWTSPEERAHYYTSDDDKDGGVERGVMFCVAGADDGTYAAYDGAP